MRKAIIGFFSLLLVISGVSALDSLNVNQNFDTNSDNYTSSSGLHWDFATDYATADYTGDYGQSGQMFFSDDRFKLTDNTRIRVMAKAPNGVADPNNGDSRLSIGLANYTNGTWSVSETIRTKHPNNIDATEPEAVIATIDSSKLSYNISEYDGISVGYRLASDYGEIHRVSTGIMSDKVTTSDFWTLEFAGIEADFSALSAKACGMAGLDWASPNCWPDLDFNFNKDDKDLFKSDTNAEAAIIEEDRKEQVNSLEIQNEQAFGIAQAEAKRNLIQDLNNGYTKSQARDNVTEHIDEYWADRQKNIISANQREVQQLKQIKATADSLGMSYSNLFHENYTEIEFYGYNYTLVNGEEIKAYDVYSGSDVLIHSIRQTGATGLHTLPDKNKVMAGDEYVETLKTAEDRRTTAYNNVNNITDKVFDNFAPGDLEVSDAMGPLEALQTSATSFDDTGAASYVATTFEQMGLAGDSYNTFNVTYSGSEFDTAMGQLFVSPQAPFSDNITAGETYNASGHAVWFTYNPENSNYATSTDLTTNFTVNEMYDKETGEKVTTTSVDQTEFYTTNVTKLENQLQAYKQALEDIQTSPLGGSGGGGSWSPFQIGLLASVFVILSLAVFIAGGVST